MLGDLPDVFAERGHIMTDRNTVDFGRVAVLAGGDSPERDVSLASGGAVHAALSAAGVDSQLVDLAARPVEQLRSLAVDRAFIACHGAAGENGVLQALCESIGLPYTGSRVAACALAMDKVRCKYIWQAMGLPTLPFVVLNENFDLAAQVAHLDYPLAIKPSNGGSSLGVSRVNSANELSVAVAKAREYDRCVLAEPWLVGRELTVSVMGQAPLPAIEIKPKQAFYDYVAKYSGGTTYHLLQEPREWVTSLQDLAMRAFAAVGAFYWGRVDALADDHGNVFLMELNLVPGMTTNSLVPKAAGHAGMSFEQLVLSVLRSSME
jgi:D-alanine-D-alanine ligase